MENSDKVIRKKLLRPDAPNIFISYKIEPDELLANCLSKFIGRVFEPAPNVFVASADGIVPSRIGWREQLNQAVRNAQLFIGVITKDSKDREWIIFEAGAAWGRNQIYAPILFDLSPSELPLSISSYQATDGFNKSSVQKLVSVISKELQLSVKNFNNSFNQFIRHAKKYKEIQFAPHQIQVIENKRFPKIIELFEKGKSSEAEAAIASIRPSVCSLEDRAYLELLPFLYSEADLSERLQKLDLIPEDLKQTKTFLWWAAFYEGFVRPNAAIELWSQYQNLQLTDGESVFPTMEIIRHLYEIGKSSEAWSCIKLALKSSNRAIRSQAAKLYTQLFIDHPKQSRLLILAGALSSGDKSLYELCFDLSHEAHWKSLALIFSDVYNREEGSFSSSHLFANALWAVGLHSLAYRAYQCGIEAGSLASIASAASLITNHPVPAAGQSLLDKYADTPSDLPDPSYLPRIRAELEQKILEEERKLDEFRRSARLALTQLSELAALTIGSMITFDSSTESDYVSNESELYKLIASATSEADFSLIFKSEKGSLRYNFKRIPPFDSVYSCDCNFSSIDGIFVATDKNRLCGILFSSSQWSTEPTIEVKEFVGKSRT